MLHGLKSQRTMTMTKYKVCLDAGHFGKYNQSPCNKEYYESEMSWKLHLKLKKQLEAKGIEVITTRKEQATDLALTTRGKKSKGCNLFLSLHSNATVGGKPDEKTDYPLVIVPVSGKGDELGKRLTECIATTMQTAQKGKYKSRKGTNGDWYGVMNGAAQVGTVGLLIEHSFHTNTRSTNWLLDDSNLKRLARAEAEVIVEWLKENAELEPTKPVSTFKKYQVKVICDSLNIRKTPNWKASDIVGAITDRGTYTIIAETELDGTTFGKLKSGKGWISLGGRYVKRV